VTTPESPDALREEVRALDQQIAELQRYADEARADLDETSDKTTTIEGAEQQDALIEQLALRRRDLVERIERT
jgi:prefoldin subunit 5